MFLCVIRYLSALNICTWGGVCDFCGVYLVLYFLLPPIFRTSCFTLLCLSFVSSPRSRNLCCVPLMLPKGLG